MATNLALVATSIARKVQERKLRIAGIQLDIDSPTRSLWEYAIFLRSVRKALPADVQISITALLDWFRDGTDIADVIQEVDEFVPQFYDVQKRIGDDSAIAARVDAAKWAPRFNAYRKRFRIGVSSFGRLRLVPGSGDGHRVVFINDLKPMDVALNSEFELKKSQTDAGELVLTYVAVRKTRIGYTDFEPGQGLQFVLPTPEAVGMAVGQVRKMGGYCAGVVFFRWPAEDETLALPPRGVLAAAGGGSQSQRFAALKIAAGDCAAVSCVDLYIEDASPLTAEPVRYIIRSSEELEYMVPNENMPVRMTGPSRIEMLLPPYCGRTRIYLGRAITTERAEYTMEESR